MRRGVRFSNLAANKYSCTSKTPETFADGSAERDEDVVVIVLALEVGFVLTFNARLIASHVTSTSCQKAVLYSGINHII